MINDMSGSVLGENAAIEEVLAFNIKTKRISKKWTQRELAQSARISSSMIEHLESGRRWASKDTVRAISRALGCRSWELYRFPTTPHFEQLNWQHAREVLDREFSRLEFLNALPPDLYSELKLLVEKKKTAVLEERIRTSMGTEKSPEYQNIKVQPLSKSTMEKQNGKI